MATVPIKGPTVAPGDLQNPGGLGAAAVAQNVELAERLKETGQTALVGGLAVYRNRVEAERDRAATEADKAFLEYHNDIRKPGKLFDQRRGGLALGLVDDVNKQFEDLKKKYVEYFQDPVTAGRINHQANVRRHEVLQSALHHENTQLNEARVKTAGEHIEQSRSSAMLFQKDGTDADPVLPGLYFAFDNIEEQANIRFRDPSLPISMEDREQQKGLALRLKTDIAVSNTDALRMEGEVPAKRLLKQIDTLAEKGVIDAGDEKFRILRGKLQEDVTKGEATAAAMATLGKAYNAFPTNPSKAAEIIRRDQAAMQKKYSLEGEDRITNGAFLHTYNAVVAQGIQQREHYSSLQNDATYAEVASTQIRTGLKYPTLDAFRAAHPSAYRPDKNGNPTADPTLVLRMDKLWEAEKETKAGATEKLANRLKHIISMGLYDGSLGTASKEIDIKRYALQVFDPTRRAEIEGLWAVVDGEGNIPSIIAASKIDYQKYMQPHNQQTIDRLVNFTNLLAETMKLTDSQKVIVRSTVANSALNLQQSGIKTGIILSHQDVSKFVYHALQQAQVQALNRSWIENFVKTNWNLNIGFVGKLEDAAEANALFDPVNSIGQLTIDNNQTKVPINVTNETRDELAGFYTKLAIFLDRQIQKGAMPPWKIKIKVHATNPDGTLKRSGNLYDIREVTLWDIPTIFNRSISSLAAPTENQPTAGWMWAPPNFGMPPPVPAPVTAKPEPQSATTTVAAAPEPAPVPTTAKAEPLPPPPPPPPVEEPVGFSRALPSEEEQQKMVEKAATAILNKAKHGGVKLAFSGYDEYNRKLSENEQLEANRDILVETLKAALPYYYIYVGQMQAQGEKPSDFETWYTDIHGKGK